jgi:photosystem II stability/assembly factor-like uncharacterized protein
MNTGYIAGWGTEIIKTTDAGNTWFHLNCSFAIDIVGTHFSSNDIGCIVGGAGKIGFTTDGGATWMNQSTGGTGILYASFLINNTTGFIVGDNGKILKTVNQGTTWNPITSGTTYNLTTLWFADANTGWITGDHGTMLKTTNSGNNWFSLNSGVTLNIGKLYFINSNTGWCTGDSGVVLKTINGGNNWVRQQSGTTNWILSPYFVSLNTGWIAGSAGLILKTINGGESWFPQASNTSNDFRCNYFLNELTGFSVGWNGTVVKTTTGGFSPTTCYFNGTNSYVTLPASNSLFYNFTNKISLEAWICVTDTNFGGSWGCGSIIQSGNQNRYAFFVNHDRRIYFYLYPWANQFHTKTQIPLNTWIHVAAVYDGQNSFTGLYINGNLDTSTNIYSGNIGGDTQTPYISIGAYYYNGSFSQNFFKGYMDEVRVWGSARTQSQIIQSSCNLINLDSTLRGYWKFNGNYSDTSMYANHGTNLSSTLQNQSYGCNILQAPVLLTPLNGGLDISLITPLTWGSVTGAASYRVQISSDSTFGTIILDSSGISGTTITVPSGKLVNLTKYFWRVSAANISGSGPYSPIWNFTTIVPAPALPNLISPVNNSVGNPVNLNLVWTKPQYAAGYNIVLATDSLFTNIALNDSTLTDTVKAITNLVPLTKYYWKVRAKNVAGWGVYSTVYNFKTVGSATQVILNLPANNTAGQPVNLTFNWFKATDQTMIPEKMNGNKDTELIDDPLAISKYWFELATDTGFTSIVTRDSSLTDTTKSVTGLNNISTYYWRVKARNQIGWGMFSTVWNFTTIVPIPNAPTLISPINNSTGNPVDLSLIWTKPLYAAGYNIILATDASFANIVLNDSTLTDSVKTLNNLTPLTTYYWKVRARNAAGWGSFSTVYNFKTVGSATQVVLNSPVNNAVNQPVSLTFNWFKSVDQTLLISLNPLVKNRTQTDILVKNSQTDEPLAVSNYWFEYGTDSTFTTILGKDSTLTDTTKTIAGLSNITKYYWRVKAKNQIGWGIFSSVWNFTTIVPIPIAPILISPLNNSTSNPINLSLIWTKPQYATGYNVVLATDAGFSNIVLNDSTLTDSVKALTNLAPLTTYYWKVRAKNIAGWGSYSTVYNFKTVGSASQVVLSSPANGATGQPISLTFKWFKASDLTFGISSIISGNRNQTESTLDLSGNKSKEQTDDPLAISYYWFEYGTDSTFSTVVGRDSLLTDTTKTLSGLNNYTKYYWRVKAKNQIGWGLFSTAWNFTTIVPVPAAPILNLPANNSTGVSLTPLLDWNDVSFAASYRIQVSSDSLFSTTLFDTTGVTLSQVTVPAGKLTGLTKYYWRVNATNAAGTSAWSTTWNFRTLQNLTLNLKAYLEGFWDGSMQVQDTLTVYLANPTTPHAFVDSAKIYLSTAGTAPVTFSKVQNGSYYIVIQHRNHLQTWSALTQSFVTNIAVNYDFTTAANKAYGNNMKQDGTAWVLYGGDPNIDGSIDAIDIFIFIPQFGNQGYLSCDFNGDGDVNGADVFIIASNFGLSIAVPSFDYTKPGEKMKIEDALKKINKGKEKDVNDSSNKIKSNSKTTNN